jgi:hypothetical protein
VNGDHKSIRKDVVGGDGNQERLRVPRHREWLCMAAKLGRMRFDSVLVVTIRRDNIWQYGALRCEPR